MVVCSGSYFFSGLAKLLHAGLAWVASGNIRWVLYASSDSQPEPNPFALFVADRPVLAHLVAAAALAVELGFPLVLWRPWLAWLFVPAVVAMHAGIGLAMHLDYSAMAVTVVVVTVDWPALADRLSPAPSTPRSRHDRRGRPAHRRGAGVHRRPGPALGRRRGRPAPAGRCSPAPSATWPAARSVDQGAAP